MIETFNWRARLEGSHVFSVNEDFILVENPSLPPVHSTPFKSDMSVSLVCVRGTLTGSINLRKYTIQSPCFVIILPEQILSYESVSSDFSGLFIAMSNQFTDNLFVNILERFPLFLSAQIWPVNPLSDDELETMKGYFSMLKRTLKKIVHPYRLEIVKHLTRAFFYETGYTYFPETDGLQRSKQELLTDTFLKSVQANYKKHRGLDFYAEQLNLTPKYLSKVVKETSGTSAADWVKNYVLSEARAMLGSTNMTVQQIGDELNFPSQSFFGKYFKQRIGMSPKEYRKGKAGFSRVKNFV